MSGYELKDLRTEMQAFSSRWITALNS